MKFNVYRNWSKVGELDPETSAQLTRNVKAYTAGTDWARKRKASLNITDSVTLSGGYWDGGSRDMYISNRRTLNYPTSPPQFGGGETPTVELMDDEVIVNLSVFQGKKMMSVYISPRYGVESPLIQS